MKRCAGFVSLFGLLTLLAYAANSLATDATSNEAPRVDTQLAEIASHPQSYRLYEQATDRVDSRAAIKIHSTATLANNDPYVQLLPGSIRYIRTDGTASADGEKALVKWSLDGESFETTIGRPGAVIMVIRSLDGIVSWYALQPELRC